LESLIKFELNLGEMWEKFCSIKSIWSAAMMSLLKNFCFRFFALLGEETDYRLSVHSYQGNAGRPLLLTVLYH